MPMTSSGPSGAVGGLAPQSSTVKLPMTPHADMQAVVVIHGMGEQRPMDTIKSFVKAVWEEDAVITANGLPHPHQVWSKPDDRAGSLELRRITTRESILSAQFPGGVRTDFYELYWVLRDNLDENAGGNRSVKRRPVAS
jgi:hypothetical protein